MEIAYYLGFTTVILVGVDHFFKQSGEPHKLVTAKAEDPNHFHPDYFGKGVKWQYPDLERSEQAYRIAKKVYEEDGRVILDATVGGHLQVFPKVDYKSIVREKSIPTESGQVHVPKDQPQLIKLKSLPIVGDNDTLTQKNNRIERHQAWLQQVRMGIEG
jgi:hypothetical protein